MRKCKVAIIHNTIAPYRHPLFEELSKDVDLVVYYCTIKDGSRNWDLWPRNYDYKYKILPVINIKTPIGKLSLNPSILKEIIKNKPHVVIIGGYVDPTMWFAFVITKLFRISIIYWTEGIKEPQSILGALTRPLRILFIKASNAIVVPGGLSRNYVIDLGANAEKIFIAPNAIDNKLFIEISHKYRLSKEELKGQIGLKGKVVILYVGQFIRRKGIEYLLRAYGKLEHERNDIALVLVGSGSLELYLKDLANSLHLKNFKIIHSGLSLEELVKIYSVADVFVLPTLEDLWGFVINEAMACGLPVISTKNSQAAIEMIRHSENGFVLNGADSEELYLAMEKLLDSGKLESMGKNSVEIVTTKFDPSLMKEMFVDAISYALSV